MNWCACRIAAIVLFAIAVIVAGTNIYLNRPVRAERTESIRKRITWPIWATTMGTGWACLLVCMIIH